MEQFAQLESSLLAAVDAINVAANDADLREDAAPLIAWARRRTLAALNEVEESGFWEHLELWAGTPQTLETSPNEFSTYLQDVVSDDLTAVLLKSGYQPPPPAGDLVLDARTTMAYVLSGDPDPNIPAAREAVNRLKTALEVLSMNRPSVGRRLLARARKPLVALMLSCAVMGGNVVQDLGTQYTAEYVGRVIEEFAGDDVAEQPAGEDDGESAFEGEKRRLEMEILKAKLREARARAVLAEGSVQS